MRLTVSVALSLLSYSASDIPSESKNEAKESFVPESGGVSSSAGSASIETSVPSSGARLSSCRCDCRCACSTCAGASSTIADASGSASAASADSPVSDAAGMSAVLTDCVTVVGTFGRLSTKRLFSCSRNSVQTVPKTIKTTKVTTTFFIQVLLIVGGLNMQHVKGRMFRRYSETS